MTIRETKFRNDAALGRSAARPAPRAASSLPEPVPTEISTSRSLRSTQLQPATVHETIPARAGRHAASENVGSIPARAGEAAGRGSASSPAGARAAYRSRTPCGGRCRCGRAVRSRPGPGPWTVRTPCRVASGPSGPTVAAYRAAPPHGRQPTALDTHRRAAEFSQPLGADPFAKRCLLWSGCPSSGARDSKASVSDPFESWSYCRASFGWRRGGDRPTVAECVTAPVTERWIGRKRHAVGCWLSMALHCGQTALAGICRGGAGRLATAGGQRRWPRRWSCSPPRGSQTQVDRLGDSGSSGRALGGRRCASHDESRTAGHAQAPAGWLHVCLRGSGDIGATSGRSAPHRDPDSQ